MVRFLSYSSIKRFQECPRSWALHYIDKIDSALDEKPAIQRGHMFHECIEHNDPSIVMDEVGMSPFDQQQVFHAAVKYLEISKSLPVPTAKEVKIINEEHGFIGYADSVTINDNGAWLIGEMKTTSYNDPVQWAMHQISQQTALYKTMSRPFCAENFITQKDFVGSSFKQIVFSNKKPLKGRGKSAVSETPQDFGMRIKGDIKVLHQIFTVTPEVESSAMQTFNYVKSMIKHLGDKSNNYPKCQNSCKSFYGLCEYFEHCWQLNLSDTIEVEKGD